ncbi:MAG: ATP-dependent carboxylate-amine ligase, partial [Candidatus Heimdallarchaeota archaeon]
NADAVGKYLCDQFYKISPVNDINNYLTSLQNICIKEKINIILPQNTQELLVLAQNLQIFSELGTQVLISKYESIRKANDKFELMKICRTED